MVSGSILPNKQHEGTVVALFFLVLREVVRGYTHLDHPHVPQRVNAALSRLTKHKLAKLKLRFALLVDMLLQSAGHQTPAMKPKPTTAEDFFDDVMFELYRWAGRTFVRAEQRLSQLNPSSA